MVVIDFFQSFDSPGIYFLMRFASLFGDKGFYVIIFPLSYWFFNRVNTISFTVLICISIFINLGLKEFFHQERPLDVALIDAEGYSFPSGHAQMTVVIWGFLIYKIRKYFGYGILTIIIIGISRLYLGVHWPLDVVGGWIIGGLLLAGFFPLENWLIKKINFVKLSIFLPLLFTLTVLISIFSNVEYGGIVMGTLFGLVSGGVIAERLDFPTQRLVPLDYIISIIVGCIGIYLLYLLVKPIAYIGEGSLFMALTIICLWISLGGPFLTQKIKLVMRI
ncbi:MAG: hypothetical protein CMG75_03045 [Candidatus Marinimicrobia bacterium]|nr:hypothetical protein [Candidatus Neomarinimicrobiota bacterium]|tara:strand:+ start:15482 stop:16312 length:831 start_codon:yes stop_codon:yes gene_type:complete